MRGRPAPQPFALRRRHERRRRLLRWAAAVAVVVALAAGGWLIWFSDVLGVRSVQVSGVDSLDPDRVRETAAIEPRTPLARLDTVAVESRVAQLERVEQVTVERRWPRTVRITVVERTAVAWAQTAGVLRAVDRFGVDFRTLEEEPDDLVEIRTSATDPRQRQLAVSAAASVISALRTDDPDLMEQVRAVTADTRDSVTLLLGGGRTVVWGSATRTEQKLQVLEALLEIEADEYDVSAPEQPTTRR